MKLASDRWNKATIAHDAVLAASLDEEWLHMEALIAARSEGDTALTPAMVAVALGVPAARLELLRALAGDSRATVSQLARATGVSPNGLRGHLAALEDLGALHSRIERVEGSFRPTRVYWIDRARVEQIAWDLYDAVADAPGSEGDA